MNLITDFINHWALLFSFLYLYTQVLPSFRPKMIVYRQIIEGLAFGFITFLAIIFSVEIYPGIGVDARVVLISFAGLFGGTLSAIITSVVAIIVRTIVGGSYVHVGLFRVSMTMSFILLYRHLYIKKKKRYKIRFIDLTLTAAFNSLALFPSLLFFNTDLALYLLKNYVPILIIYYFSTSIFFGSLIMYSRKSEKNKIDLQNSLTEKTVLLNEIHHRVKNNMAIISSILNLQSLYSDDENIKKALLESDSRIHSMGIIQESLYEHQSMSSITLDSYIGNLIDALSGKFEKFSKEVVSVQGIAGIKLSINQFFPIGLIITEFILMQINSYSNIEKDYSVVIVWNLLSDTRLSLQISKSARESNNLHVNNNFHLILIKQLSMQLEADLEISDNGSDFIKIEFNMLNNEAK